MNSRTTDASRPANERSRSIAKYALALMMALILTLAISASTATFAPTTALAQNQDEENAEQSDGDEEEDDSGGLDPNLGDPGDAAIDGAGGGPSITGDTADAGPGPDSSEEGESSGDPGEGSGYEGDDSDDTAADDTGPTGPGGTENAGDGGGGGLGQSIFSGILSWAFGTPMEDTSEKLIGMLSGWAFELPTPEGELREYYERTAAIAQPGAVTLLLLTGLMMGLRGASYTTAHATQSALPKIALFIAGLAFFPEIMTYLSNLTSNIAGVLIDPDTMADALAKVTLNGTVLGPTIIGGLTNLALMLIALTLFLVGILKSYLFAIFFIAGPLAMFLYPIKPLSGIAVSWFKGTLACLAIPLLWSIEVWVGTAIIASPEMIFGDIPGLGIFTTLSTLILAYVMIKTPFKVYEYVFYGYTSGNSFVGQVGKGVAVGALSGALKGGKS